MSTDRPLRIRQRDALLRQPDFRKKGAHLFATSLSMWNLHLWTIDNRPNAKMSDWLELFNKRRESPPFEFCAGKDFQGSFSEKITFWLEVGWLD